MDKLTFPEALKRAKEHGGHIVTQRDGIYGYITLELPTTRDDRPLGVDQFAVVETTVAEVEANLKSMGWQKEEDRLGVRRDIPSRYVWTAPPPEGDIPLGFKSWADLDDYIDYRLRTAPSRF